MGTTLRKKEKKNVRRRRGEGECGRDRCVPEKQRSVGSSFWLDLGDDQ